MRKKHQADSINATEEVLKRMEDVPCRSLDYMKATDDMITLNWESLENRKSKYIDTAQATAAAPNPPLQPVLEHDQEKSAPSFSSLKELYDLLQHFVYDHVFAEKITSLPSQQSPDEEENEHLKKTVTMLQAQLSLERQKRVTMEEEYGLVLKNSELEQQLGATDAY
ncbi:hypothetical protein MJG53_008775 [Ovis ammon polii x Ovis aries]|uniref:Uncharacterized protein n=1 Tax=Ovis ammon polii x Ovis aries TaxID=2918886 RepID=A0ACB9UXI2_9CETA|nr:hypothetical protein MJG53_008775 [Ovis ammon polii x Ovis aries]